MKREIGQKQETFLNGLLAMVAAGIFFASNIFVPLPVAMTLAIILFIVSAAMLQRESPMTFVPFCVLFFLLGVLRFQTVNILPANDISNYVNEQVYVSGTIREQPRVTYNADRSHSVRYIVEVEKIKVKDDYITASGGLIINVHYNSKEDIPEALIADKMYAYGTVRVPLNYNNPGQIDVVTMLRNEGITARFSVGTMGVEIENTDGSIWVQFLRKMAAIREHYKESMRQVMSNEDAAAIFAMLFGGYEGLNPDLTESFRMTGIIHILSVSGSHMSLIAVTVAWICNYFKLNQKITFIIGLLVIGAYTILSGFLFQVIRSAFMSLMFFFATSSKDYNNDSRRSLTLIALFIILYSPLALFHISFQLSFLATAGIIYLAPKIKIFLQSKFQMPSIMIFSFSCTLAATIVSLPVTVWYFNQLAISALLSNLIVIPILEIVIIFGLLSGIVGLFIPLAAKFIFLADSLVLGIGYEINKFIANLPASNIYFPTINFTWSILYYTALIILIQKSKVTNAMLNWCREHINLIKIICTALAIIVACGTIYSLTRPPEMQVHFIDVHQGDAALVVTPNGHAMMFDTGGVRDRSYDIGARVDVPYLYHYGVTKLDYIFLTHAHEDHAAGAGTIIKKLPVDQIITAGESKSDYAASMGMSGNAPELKNLRQAEENEIFNVDGVKVEVIYSPKITSGARPTGNEISNVYKLSFGNASFLFTGDLVKENESVIIGEHKNIKSTVLKVGHHGSKTSSSEEFIRAVSPSYAVFCVGANNTFGHPRPEVLELMKKLGVQIYRTDKNGAIVFYTDGRKMKIKCVKR